MARSTRGTRISVIKDGATGVTITPTDVSAAKPAVVTTASTTGIKDGDVVHIPAGATGMSSLDGGWFVVANLVADTSFELLGTDTTGETYTAGTSPDFTAFADPGDMIDLCFASMTFNPEQPEPVSVGTYCDPTATVAGTVAGAGTIDFTGYVDINDADYIELRELYASGNEVTFRVLLPGNGYLLFRGTVSSLNLDIPIEGAIGYAGQITLSSQPQHVF